MQGEFKENSHAPHNRLTVQILTWLSIHLFKKPILNYNFTRASFILTHRLRLFAHIPTIYTFYPQLLRLYSCKNSNFSSKHDDFFLEMSLFNRSIFISGVFVIAEMTCHICSPSLKR